MSALGTAVAAGSAAGTARAAWQGRPGGARWERTNYAGRTLSLFAGPAMAAGCMAGVAVAPGLAPRVRVTAALGTAVVGALGAYDDITGSTASKGFAGHLRALRRGEVTSGAVKVAGIGATGLMAAAAVRGGKPPTSTRGWVGAALDVGTGGALVAGTANLLNLFDLRPGRALKVGVLLGVPLALGPAPSSVLAAAPLGAAAALLPVDLGEQGMLGDCGANAAGALLGLALLVRTGPVGRAVALAGVVGLTAASEKVSFSRVIAQTPALRAVDMLGRRSSPEGTAAEAPAPPP